jgi:hypothetical protein
MFILRLEPPIELDTPRGRGLAVLFRDYGHDSQDQWTVVLGDGSFWTFPNPQVRATANVSWGRSGRHIERGQLADEGGTGQPDVGRTAEGAPASDLVASAA